ncbi:sugar ABC transporter ATP-binding protein [Caldibacillus lycopersici]|uniref:Sugar ABC transporter ATP-binding protein n=1 Tax=Perspicuibacillus lycopersici TaxID=1325689 RepID=A0AAE3IT23_9BACI|nr:sugar ABC transporter ATP-binding protein [Perspicuibacillus lycopersici]MCU9613128.1 sugar ABC transporter ATP-binding protein [Perspicuibacillus lycopersici]
MKNTILELHNINKSFPGVKALSNVNFTLRKGEVHALMGENGAGKSTLMKVLTGVNKPDAGLIKFENQEYKSFDIIQSEKLGISMIYQELNLIPYLTIAENIFLARELKKKFTIDKRKMNAEAKQLFQRLGVEIDPTVTVKNLNIALQQIVEIVKAVSKNVKVLVMDEPTAPLTNDEVELLFVLVEKLKADGVSIIYISHRMDEIFRLCDRVTVLRDGQYVETKEISKTNKDELIRLMVGRDITNQYPPRIEVTSNTKVALKVRNLTNEKLKNVSIDVKKGEIVGIGGLVGAGRTELLRAIYGVDKIYSGTIQKDNIDLHIKHPSEAIHLGIVLVPEDRKQQGLLLEMNIKDNISLPSLKDLKKGLVINQRKIQVEVKELIKSLSIKTPSMNQISKNLSGGNQQKVVIAKWLLSQADILMFDEPTRGIDVGAKYEIYSLMNKLKNEGKSIIMVSSDMPELIGMSDRIYVMCEGQMSGHIMGEDINQEKILELASNYTNPAMKAIN